MRGEKERQGEGVMMRRRERAKAGGERISGGAKEGKKVKRMGENR